MKKSNQQGATNWDGRATSDDTYAGDTFGCPCGCGGECHRDFHAFVRFFAPHVDESVRDRFLRAVVDPQVRHRVAGVDAEAWEGCGRTNNKAQRDNDEPATPVDFFPVTTGDPAAIRRDKARRENDLRWRGFAR